MKMMMIVTHSVSLESFMQTSDIPPSLQRMDFLWVRWFGCDLSASGGFDKQHLHRVEFLDSQDSSAFGFLDPVHIIRSVFLIPAFSFGRTQDLLEVSTVNSPQCY
jgi:hypothetical protein